MRKYKIFTIVATVCLALIVLCTAYVTSVPNQTGYVKYYNASGNAMTTGISSFEAMLNYEQMMSSMTMPNEPFSMATYTASEHTIKVFNELRMMYQNCLSLILISLLVLVISIFILKKVRRYQCFLWGGIGAIGLNILIPILLLVTKFKLCLNVVEMFRGNAAAIFYDDAVMAALIPSQWALRTLFLFERNLFLGAILCIIIYFVLMQRAKPHRF